MSNWSPWHGCHKISDGCDHCYVYRLDKMYGRDPTIVKKTGGFNAPIARDRYGRYKMQPDGDYVYTCFSTDFLVKEADEWRPEVWSMIKRRSDLQFFFITKRINRFMDCIPDDWNDGYDNVTVACTVENQYMADYRLPVFKSIPIKHKQICVEPLLEYIDITKYLDNIDRVIVGGESGSNARPMNYDWVRLLRTQCLRAGVPSFWFKQTGARFLFNNKLEAVARKNQYRRADDFCLSYDRSNLK